jgi:uncharacterized protein YqjF (DUF2071 family)
MSPEARGAIRRPEGEPALYQSWRDLLSLHYPVEPEEIAKLIPEGVELELFPDSNGKPKAWVGLTCMHVDGVHGKFWPKLPGLSAYNQTNVQTYVHRDGSPGLVLLSVDAAKWIACRLARRRFRLPYRHALLKHERKGPQIVFEGHRAEGQSSAELSLSATVGESTGIPEAGTLSSFLLDRYLIYTEHEGTLLQVPMWRRQMALSQVTVDESHQSFTAALKIPNFAWEHVAFCPVIDVEIFPVSPAR